MSTNDNAVLQKVQSSFGRLTEVAAKLNAASDDLGRVIVTLEEALKKLNLGITSWYQYAGNNDDDGSFWSRNIGYTKIGTKWGIALRRYSGHHGSPDDGPDEELLFNDGPRQMRIEAVEYIPEMIEKLIADAEKTVERLRRKTTEASQLTAVITPPAPQSVPRRK